MIGTPHESFSWMQYVSNTKNQGATTTCYLQIWATMMEIVMTKRLREISDEEWKQWQAYQSSRDYVKSQEEAAAFWENYIKTKKKTCVISAYDNIASERILRGYQNITLVKENLRGLATLPNTR